MDDAREGKEILHPWLCDPCRAPKSEYGKHHIHWNGHNQKHDICLNCGAVGWVKPKRKWELEMTEEQSSINLGKCFVAGNGFRWRGGMRTLPDQYSRVYLVVCDDSGGEMASTVQLMGPIIPVFNTSLLNLLPDMTNGATQGAVLDLLREISGDETLCVRKIVGGAGWGMANHLGSTGRGGKNMGYAMLACMRHWE